MNFSKSKLRMVSILILFYVSVLLLAAILSPLLFCAAKFCATSLDFEVFRHLISKKFPKFFDRSRLMAFIFLLIPLCRCFKLNLAKDLFFKKIHATEFFKTFCVGICLVALIFVWSYFYDGYRPRGAFDGCYICSFLKFLSAACLIGILEEIIFRGIIFQILSRNINQSVALIFTSLIFAHCHLSINSNASLLSDEFSIYLGFKCAFIVFFNFKFLSFLNLFTLGCLLSTWLLKHKSIFYPIAFHIGSVFAIMIARNVIRVAPTALSSSVSILDSWFTFTVQAGAICVLVFNRKSSREKFSRANFL